MSTIKDNVKKVLKMLPNSQESIILLKRKEYYFKNFKSVSESILKRVGNNQNPIIYLFACPKYRNMGDHAIVVAEKKLISDYCPNFNVVDIYLDDTYIAAKVIKKLIKKNDIIAFNGGGYIGDEYLHAEKAIRYLLGIFSENKCIFFPQTIFFSNTEVGNKELNKTVDSYSKHPNLLLVAREMKSYNLMKERFVKNKILLAPDIVFYLNETKVNEERINIVTCLRDDVESTFSISERREIINNLKNTYGNIIVTDTVNKYDVDCDHREIELNKLFNTFKTAKVIITDRIHGMIFAAITETPCVVLSNYNYKVKGTYEWIKHLNYIKFAKGPDEINGQVKELLNFNTDKYDNSFANKYYNEIVEYINS
ncbi:polysaccharide pyruvyl transferase family protein [Neobacillus kokaensis]|uniref:Pyruvyl transferase EpsI n=1 Tax=Neobacillus kokaensis TaxID=2759023 RepID=A0ABQ3N588_9BACI|nr:polysaccharide pyruvyl transferase family protein [Neobacillus kokaensis]GHH98658.1 putative pyruvyl transferase EpsI [Neobacillus kokaensis]